VNRTLGASSVKRTFRRGLQYASVTCALSALSIPAAFAQTAPAASGANAPAPELQALSTVVVTGTHILQSSAGEAQPIQSISASQILQSGYTNVSTVLQNIPQAGASLTSEAQSDSSNGDATTIDLRYLGASRTLVLINGQRWTPQLNGTVNLTAIPASMIEHVDVLQDGASAIYGSDAIAGVVNIIMRQDFNGAEAHAYYGAYDDPGETPDGRTQEYDFTMGKSDEHSGIMFAAEFQQNGSVLAQNRYESAPGPFTQTTYLPGFDPSTLTISSPALANQTIGSGTCTKAGSCQLQVASGPNYNPTLGNFTNEMFNTAYEPSQFMIHKPDENQSFYLSSHYQLAHNVNFTMLGA
jgi:outer membrane receptor protein involved in Fe transport